MPAPDSMSAPWLSSTVHSDATDSSSLGDDELAKHVLRILIAEARREGLEL